MGVFANTANRIAGLFGYVRADPQDVVEFRVREGLYAVNQQLYDGTIYLPESSGGSLGEVLRTFIGPAWCDTNRFRIIPGYMPFGPVVDAYQYVLPGTWGAGITLADTVDDEPINQAIREPIRTIWRNSLLDSEKGKIIRWAANFGTVGMRITTGIAREGQPPRVAITADHPARLFNFEEDDEGNVTAVCLKYKQRVNANTTASRLSEPDWQSVDVVEIFTKDEISVTFDGVQQREGDQQRNALGFCPYVILRHKDNGTPYGDWAYKAAEPLVHRINWRITRQDKSIDRHQFPKWFAAAGGDSPVTDVQMGDEDLTYVQTVAGTPPPVLEALVPKIDQKAAQEFWQELREQVKTRQPETLLNEVRLLGNVSGEALSRILKPTEKAIGDARPGYVHAFSRAMQMALSAGVVAGAWDIGTGVGSADAADRAYREGKENFAFGPMPLLPPTAYESVQQAKADQADAQAKLDSANRAKTIGLPRKEQWRLAGYSDEQIEVLEDELSQQSVLETESEGTADA